MIKNIFIPQNFKTLILKKERKYIYFTDSFIKLILPIFYIFTFNKFLNILTIKTKYWNNLRKFFTTYSLINLETIKFKGKGFKLTKKNNILNFLFNFSHIMYVINNKNILKKINKNKFLLINPSLVCNNTFQKILKLRFVNTYNLNGLRSKRQLIYKRKGKTITN